LQPRRIPKVAALSRSQPPRHEPTQTATALHRDSRSQWRRQDHVRSRISSEDRGRDPICNADLIAQGLSPLDPQLAALAGGRLLLQGVNRLAAARADFAFESTLSGLPYARQLRSWKTNGYRIEIAYLRLRSPQLALRRIAARVRQGGHNVPRADVLRRFARGWENFLHIYRPLADEWTVYDNSGESPQLIERWP
jgi:predicted ABC-type ATPase